MTNAKSDQPTRQLYASIREDVYLASKARAAELRMPLKRFIEHALEMALTGESEPRQTPQPTQVQEPESPSSIWDDEYLRMQTQQPVGAPIELSRDEAARVVRETFGGRSQD